LDGRRVVRRPLERHAHGGGSRGKRPRVLGQTRRSRRMRLEVSQRPPPIFDISS
jgi:hypothetical protein